MQSKHLDGHEWQNQKDGWRIHLGWPSPDLRYLCLGTAGRQVERGFDKTAAAGMNVEQLRVQVEVVDSELVEGIEVESFSVHQQLFEQSPEYHKPAEIDRLGSMAAEYSG